MEAEELSRAIAQALDAHDQAGEERRADELLAAALRVAKDAYRAQRAQRLATVMDAVGRYCSYVRRDVLKAMHDDPRMPRPINYCERYEALLKMRDTEEVLRRIGQTVDLAERALAQEDGYDVQAVLAQAAAAYAGRVALLDGIVVAEPDEEVADRTAKAAPPTPGDVADDEVDEAMERAFRAAVGERFNFENGTAAKATQALDRVSDAASRVGSAVDAAVQAADEAALRAARAIAGRELHIPKAPEFKAGSLSEVDEDAGQLGLLAEQVRASYLTLGQVAHDNGLFAVFAHDSGDGIPNLVEEDEGGDSTGRAIERMHEFNKRRYYGLLDDDFLLHVDAFWYGFEKLMKGVNGLAKVDLGPFNQYCNSAAAGAKRAAAELGAASMDSRQANAFCDEVRKRAKKES